MSQQSDLAAINTCVQSIISDTVSRLALVYPSDIDTLGAIIASNWPEADEIVDQVAGEATWILKQTGELEET